MFLKDALRPTLHSRRPACESAWDTKTLLGNSFITKAQRATNATAHLSPINMYGTSREYEEDCNLRKSEAEAMLPSTRITRIPSSECLACNPKKVANNCICCAMKSDPKEDDHKHGLCYGDAKLAIPKSDMAIRVQMEDHLLDSARMYPYLKDKDAYDLYFEAVKTRVVNVVEGRYCYDWSQELLEAWQETEKKWSRVIAEFNENGQNN